MIGAVMIGIPAAAMAAVVTTGTYLIEAGQTVDEDVYIAATTVRIDGVVAGDVIAAASSISIGGTIEGDLLVLSQGTVRVEGTVRGSVRGAVRTLDVPGSVADDVAVVALDTGVSGSVGRDLLPVGVRTQVAGDVGRDVRGRAVSTEIGGEVGRDVDMTVRSMDVTADATIGGDLITRSGRPATVAEGASIGGQIIEIGGRSGFFTGLILDVATIVGMLALLAGGIVLLWLAPATSHNAVGSVTAHPWRSLLAGLGVIVAVPVATVLLAFTLVGIPFAVMLALLAFVGWFYGPVPALAAAGSWALRGRGGVYGGFVAAAVVWRLIAHFVPWVGVPLLVLGVIWGAGAWALGIWQTRRAGIA